MFYNFHPTFNSNLFSVFYNFQLHNQLESFLQCFTISNPTVNSNLLTQSLTTVNPHTQLAIRFSKWKAKYFCPVENFLKRVVVNLRRAQKILTTKRRAFHDENGLQRPKRRMEKTHTPDTPHSRRCGSFCRHRLGIYRGLV